MKLVLDTNFLMHMAKFHIAIEDVLEATGMNIEPAILEASMHELEKLIKAGNFSEKKSAKLALSIAKAKNIEVIETGKGYVDDMILGLDPKEFMVATNDAELKKKLKEKGFKLAIIRQKKYAKVE